MDWLLDCWQMAAWSGELDEAGALLARTICDVPLVLFRTQAGPAALMDACPHRFAPLSRGRRIGEDLQCGYHGLTFAADGGCVRNPHGPISRNMRVRAFPTLERYGAVWVWMGESARADPAAMPELAFLEGPAEGLANRSGYLHGQAGYLLYVDNLLDLSHANYLHASTVGGDSFVDAGQEVADDDRGLTVSWINRKLAPGPLEIELGLFVPEAQVDRITTVRWFPPAAMELITEARSPNAPPAVHAVAHILTPETAGSTHYFFAASVNSRIEDAATNRRLAEIRDHILRTEDDPMIVAVQQRMGPHDLLELRPVILATDKAAVLARRKLAALIKAQNEPGPVTA
jgi:vanillate O-demethylase monooxygenase subunit